MASLLGTGIYSIPEAVRLTGVSPWRVRRWLKGYEYTAKSGRRRSPAVWHGQLDPIDGRLALGFLDLLEVRCVGALVSAGVSWRCLRDGHRNACRALRHDHPFCTNRFATDGKTVLLRVREQNEKECLWDMATLQGVFDRLINPFLDNVEFDAHQTPVRWWPRGPGQRIVLDPRRNLGQPTSADSGIPTRVLANSVAANGDMVAVAQAFGVPVDAVKAAAEFERWLDA